MHFVLQTPSLQHIVLVKITVHLWTLRNIFTRITRLPVYAINQNSKEWVAMKEKVQSKVSDLPLPPLCRKQLLNLVQPLGREIIRWCHYHRKDNTNFQFLENVLAQHLRWTMHGTIDYKKTAELIVGEESLDTESRFKIACINCLEDQARELYESMGEEQRQKYINRVRNPRRRFDHHQLVVFFTCTLIGEVYHSPEYLQRLMSESRSSFRCCLFMEMTWRGNRATCEYLFGKLDQREKEQVFEQYRRVINNCICEFPSGSLLFYLSKMNEVHREMMFRECIVELLLCLLDWPLQILFVEAAECGWPTMNDDKCTTVLCAIIFKITHGVQDYDYAQLFCECWRLCRADFKRDFISNDELLGDLLKSKREELTELVLNEASAQQILVFCDENYFVRQLLRDGRVISDYALLKCKKKAALISLNDEEDEEKRLKNESLTLLVDIVMNVRNKED